MIFLLPTDTCYGLAWEFTEQDYHEIYRLKWRDFSKQLAFLVEDFEDMKTYIEIADNQIEFLKKYPYPWSFLWKKNPYFILPDFLDSNEYEMISLRVAQVCIPTIPLSNHPTIPPFPLFLTSANISGKGESKTLAEAREYFSWVIWIDGWTCDNPPSDIFSINRESNIEYKRKNYGN